MIEQLPIVLEQELSKWKTVKNSSSREIVRPSFLEYRIQRSGTTGRIDASTNIAISLSRYFRDRNISDTEHIARRCEN